MERAGKDAVMQADRDGHAGRGGVGKTGGGKRQRQTINADRQRGNRWSSEGEKGNNQELRILEIDVRNRKRERRNVR